MSDEAFVLEIGACGEWAPLVGTYNNHFVLTDCEGADSGGRGARGDGRSGSGYYTVRAGAEGECAHAGGWRGGGGVGARPST